MTRLSILLVCVVAVLSVSCGGRQPPATSEKQSLRAADPKVATLSDVKPPARDDFAPPKDARWTLFCQSITGSDHVAASKRMKDDLMQHSGLNKWYVVHEASQSILYYGFYRSFNDAANAKESQRAQADRSSVDRLTDKLGNRPFQHCFFVALNSPDPAAPADWDLRNARGFWTLQIAAYLDDPRRKEAAVESVREFRKAGIEAYFYHGETVSSVCIGAWPEEAVARQEAAVAGSPDPNQPIMVSNVPLPSHMVRDLRDEKNQRIRYLEARMDIVDPSMRRALEQFPEHAVNGYVQTVSVQHPVTKQTVQQAEQSIVFQIPQPEPSILTSGPSQFDRGEAQQAMPPLLTEQQRPGNRLRSVGN
jgi:hypothetical protein